MSFVNIQKIELLEWKNNIHLLIYKAVSKEIALQTSAAVKNVRRE